MHGGHHRNASGPTPAASPVLTPVAEGSSFDDVVHSHAAATSGGLPMAAEWAALDPPAYDVTLLDGDAPLFGVVDLQQFAPLLSLRF
jgi:hypothetical protein